MNRNFVLGLGAQKAASTWIWALLQNKHFVPPRRKELHFLNNIPPKFSDTLLHSNNFMTIRHFPDIHLRNPESFRLCARHYFSFFYELSKRPLAKSTGEITPAYALLSQEKLQIIKEEMYNFNFRPKVIFVIRDPVDRITSAFRMELGRGKIKHPFECSIDELFLNYALRPNVRLRSTYEYTIQNLHSTFTDDELFIGIFEEITKANNILGLADFLEMEFDKSKISEVKNSSQYSFYPKQSTIEYLRSSFDQTYREMANLFPKIRECWLY